MKKMLFFGVLIGIVILNLSFIFADNPTGFGNSCNTPFCSLSTINYVPVCSPDCRMKIEEIDSCACADCMINRTIINDAMSKIGSVEREILTDKNWTDKIKSTAENTRTFCDRKQIRDYITYAIVAGISNIYYEDPTDQIKETLKVIISNCFGENGEKIKSSGDENLFLNAKLFLARYYENKAVNLPKIDTSASKNDDLKYYSDVIDNENKRDNYFKTAENIYNFLETYPNKYPIEVKLDKCVIKYAKSELYRNWGYSSIISYSLMRDFINTYNEFGKGYSSVDAGRTVCDTLFLKTIANSINILNNIFESRGEKISLSLYAVDDSNCPNLKDKLRRYQITDIESMIISLSIANNNSEREFINRFEDFKENPQLGVCRNTANLFRTKTTQVSRIISGAPTLPESKRMKELYNKFRNDTIEQLKLSIILIKEKVDLKDFFDKKSYKEQVKTIRDVLKKEFDNVDYIGITLKKNELDSVTDEKIDRCFISENQINNSLDCCYVKRLGEITKTLTFNLIENSDFRMIIQNGNPYIFYNDFESSDPSYPSYTYNRNIKIQSKRYKFIGRKVRLITSDNCPSTAVFVNVQRYTDIRHMPYATEPDDVHQDMEEQLNWNIVDSANRALGAPLMVIGGIGAVASGPEGILYFMATVGALHWTSGPLNELFGDPLIVDTMQNIYFGCSMVRSRAFVGRSKITPGKMQNLDFVSIAEMNSRINNYKKSGLNPGSVEELDINGVKYKKHVQEVSGIEMVLLEDPGTKTDAEAKDIASVVQNNPGEITKGLNQMCGCRDNLNLPDYGVSQIRKEILNKGDLSLIDVGLLPANERLYYAEVKLGRKLRSGEAEQILSAHETENSECGYSRIRPKFEILKGFSSVEIRILMENGIVGSYKAGTWRFRLIENGPVYKVQSVTYKKGETVPGGYEAYPKHVSGPNGNSYFLIDPADVRDIEVQEFRKKIMEPGFTFIHSENFKIQTKYKKGLGMEKIKENYIDSEGGMQLYYSFCGPYKILIHSFPKLLH